MKGIAPCGGQNIFDPKPFPKPPTSPPSLSSWTDDDDDNDNNIDSIKTDHLYSFADLFDDLSFKDQEHDRPESTSISSYPPSSPSSPFSYNYSFGTDLKNNEDRSRRYSVSFSSPSSETLSICTEGIRCESYDDDIDDDIIETSSLRSVRKISQSRRRKSKLSSFPPPISSIGRSGKPWVCFKSFRENGRFILKEIRSPTQEWWESSRENGRLKLQYIMSDEEDDNTYFQDENDDEDEDENLVYEEEIGDGNEEQKCSQHIGR